MGNEVFRELCEFYEKNHRIMTGTELLKVCKHYKPSYIADGVIEFSNYLDKKRETA